MCEHRPFLMLLFVLLPASVLAAAQTDKLHPVPQDAVEGRDIYQHYCAACHGTDGQGHGPAAAALKHTVPDLTRLRQRNGGVFPATYVRAVVEGNGSEPSARTTRVMPSFGPVFHELVWDQDLGEVRLDAIGKYLASIQEGMKPSNSRTGFVAGHH